MDNLKITKKHEDNGLKIFFIGNIAGNSHLPDLSKENVQTFIFDFRKMSYLNSIGIAKWVTWINDLIKSIPKTKITFENCPQIFVNQINTIKDFLPDSASVESFAVPYYCEDCNLSTMVTYHLGKEYIISEELGLRFYHPDVDCKKCEQPMELDVVEAKYFAFLKKNS